MGMEELVRMKKGWPGNAQQFCTMHLKGIPFLHWLDEADPTYQARVLVGKRRAESAARANTEEFVHNSEYHGGRILWHPLYKHTNEERDELVKRSGLPLLTHRSQECSPCVNANRNDFMLLTPEQIERVNTLEVEIGKPMFRPKRFNTMGIFGVVTWARHGTVNKRLEAENDLFGGGCDGAYGCGL
jgi:3'-phosphoadenosine 5'-phosphosulfate sulfotransferase (PAPS reductase)/FAD synthetase